MVYSVWIVPPEPLFSRFSKLIEMLAREFGTERFVPHVTLVGNINQGIDAVLEQASSFCAELDPCVISLGKVNYSERFFRSLFVCVERTPDVQLAYDRASEVFGIAKTEHYEPHVSLMYGDVSVAAKIAAIESIGSFMRDSFVAHSLRVYETDPRHVSRWRQLGCFSLRSTRAR